MVKKINSGARKRLVLGSVTTLLVGLAVLGPAAAASASDWGGYADPNSCSNNSLVKEVAVTNAAGQYVGLLQIKWSGGCPGNYARYQSAVGPVQTIGLSIHSQVGWQNKAGTDEVDVSTVWTRIIALNSPSDTVCAYLGVSYYGYGNASKTVCA